MPLELDDREPPEDDPDAPAPAASILRQIPVPMISIAPLASGAPMALSGNGSDAGDVARSAPVLPVPARTCFLMRARKNLDGNPLAKA